MSTKTARRDDFPAKVIATLAARAGHRCSICGKATSGPGADPATALSDGIAAHITAASSGGPRFDPLITVEERSGVDNGIWVCTEHGRAIDASPLSFSISALRGLKLAREELAAKEMRVVDPPDSSACLVELPYATTTYQVFDIVRQQPYIYATTSTLRELVQGSPDPSRLLGLATKVIPEILQTHPPVAGILSTALSVVNELWQPSASDLGTLTHLSTDVIRVGDFSHVATIEPLAFALAAKGDREVHRQTLERLVNDRHWREADATRIRKYYGSLGIELGAILRHWNDPFRKGLLRANDVSRLLDLVLSQDLADPGAKQRVLALLEQHADVLVEEGEPLLGRRLAELVGALQRDQIGRGGDAEHGPGSEGPH